MGYVIAGYSVTLGSLGLYALWVTRRAARLRREVRR